MDLSLNDVSKRGIGSI